MIWVIMKHRPTKFQSREPIIKYRKRLLKKIIAVVQLHRAHCQHERFEASANPLAGPQQHQIHYRTGKTKQNPTQSP